MISYKSITLKRDIWRKWRVIRIYNLWSRISLLNSDDTYSYYNSLGDHADKGELGLFGGEVIPVYTNVENGLGVLISTNAQQIYIRPVQP